jgi:hypothetical protein
MGHSDGGHGSVALLLADRERELCEDIGHKQNGGYAPLLTALRSGHSRATPD